MLKSHDPHFGLAAKCSNYIMLHFNVILLHAMRNEHIMFDLVVIRTVENIVSVGVYYQGHFFGLLMGSLH